MVSGLLAPTLIAYFSRRTSSRAALVSMIGGGCTTLGLEFLDLNLPFGLDATLFGILTSFSLYLLTYLTEKKYV